MAAEADNLRLVVLLSGSGTNLQSFLDRSAEGTLLGEVAAVVSDRPGAYGLNRARKANVPVHVVEYRKILSDRSGGAKSGLLKSYDSNQRILSDPDTHSRMARLERLLQAEKALIETIDTYRPDYILLAGFMRLLTPYFLNHYNRGGEMRVVNIHPALLPAFPGRHGYEDTYAYGCKWGGITVHFVDEGEDTGPVIAQAVYPLFPGENLELVKQRGLRLEYEVYAQVVNWLARGQVHLVPGPGERPVVRIDDPDYPAVLRSWTEAALELAGV
jgi:phosphoribosylglycinamide formyltransferase-1